MSGNIDFNLFDLIRLNRTEVSEGQAISPAASSPGVRDELSVSEQSIIDSRDNIVFPTLPYPFQLPEYDSHLNIDKVKEMLEIAQHESISRILDKWLENIEEVGEMQKQEQKEHLEQLLNRLFLAEAEEIRGATRHEDIAVLSAVTALLVVTASVISQVGAAAAISQPGLTAILELVDIAISIQVIPPQFTGILGMIGALFATAAYYPTLAATLRDADGNTSEIRDLQFAQNYLRRVVRLVQNPDFFQLIQYTVLARDPTAESLNEKQQQKLISVVKLVLLFTSLALYYKVETGHLTGQEIGDMVSGKLELPEDDPRQPILVLIRNELLNFPEPQRIMLIERYLEYFDGNPSLDELLEPNEIIRQQGDNHDFERISQTGA
ncbi:MAG: hypothetical protein Tsb0021_03430 [Chlamydiales bacterium]